jgi:hypothetical protein
MTPRHGGAVASQRLRNPGGRGDEYEFEEQFQKGRSLRTLVNSR